MPNTIEILALLLALDSLAVGFGLGAATPRRDRVRLAAAFAACDGLASFAGWAAGVGTSRDPLAWCEWLGPVAVGGYGLFVLSLADRSRHLTEHGGRFAFVLPVCLGLDNFIAGLGVDRTPAEATAVTAGFAAVSGLFALFGLWAGATAADRVRPRTGWLAGATLMLVATALAVKEVLS